MVVSDVEVDGEYQFERVRYSSSPEHLRSLAEWLIAQQVEEVVMESTAQYWKAVWGALERYWKPSCQEREGIFSVPHKALLRSAEKGIQGNWNYAMVSPLSLQRNPLLHSDSHRGRGAYASRCGGDVHGVSACRSPANLLTTAIVGAASAAELNQN